MRFLRIAVLLLPLLLAACGLTAQQQADYAAVQRSGVNSAVYDKMVHGDDLSLYDIKALSHAGVSDAVVLRYLQNRQTVYLLTAEDVGGLRKAGVSTNIVDFMLQTPRMYTNYYPARPGSASATGRTTTRSGVRLIPTILIPPVTVTGIKPKFAQPRERKSYLL